MKTESEDITSKINSHLFFSEFTFDENDFYPSDGKKELADNVLWLDDLLIIIQIKERNRKDVKTKTDENNWFKNTVLKKAKRQIKNSLDYFNTYDEILIKNRRERLIDISSVNMNEVRKLIIYKPNSNLLDFKNRRLKFYVSNEVGNIHLFELEDYYWICRFLITPTELNEYLCFREQLYLRHKDIIDVYPEQYILAHFLHTDDVSYIKNEYIDSLSKLEQDNDEYNLTNFIDSFVDKIRIPDQKESIEYYSIIKEIAKLKRYELKEFKIRFVKIIEEAKSNMLSMPYKFLVPRTECGFVFISLVEDKSEYWENALINITETFKYKHKLKKCLGVIVHKYGEYFDVNWAFLEYEWEVNENLDRMVQRESELYGNGEIQKMKRYNLINN